jgi:hypothetical protein
MADAHLHAYSTPVAALPTLLATRLQRFALVWTPATHPPHGPAPVDPAEAGGGGPQDPPVRL